MVEEDPGIHLDRISDFQLASLRIKFVWLIVLWGLVLTDQRSNHSTTEAPLTGLYVLVII